MARDAQSTPKCRLAEQPCACEHAGYAPCGSCEARLDELRGVWLSRVLFNPFVGWAPETRSFDQFLDDHVAAFTPRTDGWKPSEGEF